VLTAASLMVGARAADAAVEVARRNPRLGVGLHLVLVDGRPVLPPARVPDLVDRRGCFRPEMALQGVRFLGPRVKRQLASEITAQFEAFAATGLPLDHVNAHKHFHLHPVVTELIELIGPRYGMRAVRAPVEPAAVLDAVEPGAASVSARLAEFYAKRLRTRLRRAGLTAPDAVFGLRWTGYFSTQRLRRLFERLPAGLVEVYLHPATAKFPEGAAKSAPRAELEALLAVAPPPGVRLTNFQCA
jgi:hopanoid biosynthesis associated protein HpnK